VAAQRNRVVATEPLLLAIESATPAIGVALLRGEELLAEAVAPRGSAGAQVLLPLVDSLLAERGIELGAVEAFAVSVGPGSFTGLRIGIATAKGLAFGTGRLVAPVSTLAALARRAGGDPAAVVAALDARRGEVYAAIYPGAANGPDALLEEGVYTPEELAAQAPPRCCVVGDGVAVCGELLRERLGPGVRLLPPPDGDLRAADVGVLGARLLAAGGGVEADQLAPRYLRRAEAEVKRTGVRFEG
jgi:tRNA threonylcarbamoyladenosine biosynthesis protein TsaB